MRPLALAQTRNLTTVAASAVFAACCFAPSAVLAQDAASQTTAQRAFIEPGDAFQYGYGLWTCVPSADDLFQMSYDQAGVRVNNISVAVQRDTFTGFDIIQMRAAVSNRGQQRAAVSVQFAGFDENEELVLSMNMKEMFGSVPAGGSQDLSSAVYLGEVAIEIRQFCIKPFLGLRN